ncbi:MAG: GNAT family N-acetyltransferase [Hyphomicrobiales bacterium]|nr:GNAT family N-acetyltransferase [Hyphomicrobiales bacterium]
MTLHPEIVLELSGPAQIEELLPLVADYHAFEDVETSAEQRRYSVAKLLGDQNLGEIWLVRNLDRLIGYIAVCYSYSIEFGGRDAFVDEFYVAAAERGKGIGGRVLKEIAALLRARGIVAVHLEVDGGNERARAAYARAGFSSRDKYHVMSLVLEP